MTIRLRRGLELPIPGVPEPRVHDAPLPGSVAVLGDDFPGVRCAMQVEVGARVRAGQVLFTDRQRPAIGFTAPAAGTVAAIHRGDARRLVAVVIETSGSDAIELPRAGSPELRGWSAEQTTRWLLDSGDWIALRTRPFGRIATPGTEPDAIFVRAMDSEPLAADTATVLRDRSDDLGAGLTALSRLTRGRLYLCARPGSVEPPDVERLELATFDGPHPAGLVGTHIHHLLPVSRQRRVWYVGYQDVLAIGRALRSGRPDAARVIALGGPAVWRPRLLRTVRGAGTEALVRGELSGEPCRIVSGSVLSGRTAAGPGAFLGRYHEQVCAIAERAPQAARSWWVPGRRRARRVPLWRARQAWSSELHGEATGFLPLDVLDRAFPLHLPLSPLRRALAAGVARAAAAFGALQLEEEDLALSSFLCPAKLDYGPLLRTVLDQLAEQLA